MQATAAPGTNGKLHMPWVRPFTEAQLTEFRASGLSDEAIREHVVCTDKPPAINRILKRSDGERFGPCAVYIYRDSSGTPDHPFRFSRVKPTTPRLKEDGKPIKYEQPVGASNRAFFPTGRTIAALADPSQPLIVVEGEKKALKAAQEGFPCIGLGGVTCWVNDGAILPELAAVAWRGREVFIVFDAPDTTTNKDVMREERKLAQALAQRGAVVKVVRLPPGPPGADGKPGKVGLDDFLVAQGERGPDALRELLAAALPPEKPEPKGRQKKRKEASHTHEADDDPHRLARLFIDDSGATAIAPERLTLRYWRGEWVEWGGTAYRAVPAKEVKARLTAAIKREFDKLNRQALHDYYERKKAHAGKNGDGKGAGSMPEALKVTTRLIGDVTQALSGVALLPGTVEPPAWLTGAGPWPASEVLAARNGLIHLPTFVAGKPDCDRGHGPDFFCLNALDYDFEDQPPEPREWLAFLEKLWPDDPEAAALLQEWFGYCLLPDTAQQKILLVIGPKRSGKGTIARVLRGLVGEANVAGPTLSSLATNFGLWPLLGKTLAVVSDARLGGKRSDLHVITERLLSISGEDALTVDRKNLEPLTVRLPVRFVILTNELPRLDDASGAMPSRFLMLHTPRSWYDQEDVGLTGRLLRELPGILLWSLKGYRRLRDRGHFQQPESGKELIEDMEDLASPVGAFVRECCALDDAAAETVKALHDAWVGWNKQRGVEHPSAAQTFGRDLLAACPRLRRVRPREGESRERKYTGIRLLPACPWTGLAWGGSEAEF